MHTKYGRIADDLREAILGGRYKAGDKLPPIPDLMRSYDVARDTVRDAIGALTHEGLVTPLRGVGTVVREITPVALAYDPKAPARTWTQQNSDPSAADVVVEAGWDEADPDIAERLGLAAGARVVRRLRHQSRGGGIAQLHEQWIPEQVANDIARTPGTNLADKDDVSATDLFSLMSEAGHDPAVTTETIGTRMPAPEERDVMGLPPGVPVLVTKRTTRDVRDMAVETSTMVGAGDRMTQSFTVSLRPAGDQ